jgi:16S rRNA (guanine527-N7)-methyltransferase
MAGEGRRDPVDPMAGEGWRDPVGPMAGDVGFEPAPQGWSALLAALDEGRRRGFLGPDQEPAAVARHAAGFAPALGGAGRIVDLGSGGGVPGLVLAVVLPSARLALVDSSVSRTDWLHRLVRRLGLEDRVRVVAARAEVLGHDPAWRETHDAVVARSFAPPLVAAECATALLRLGGRLVVSEPPVDRREERWPAGALDELGLRRVTWSDPSYVVLEKVRPAPTAVPRARRVRGHTS